MRFILLASLCACAACFPMDETELVRVRVPVYTGPAEVNVLPQSQRASTDPCDRAAPDISTCTPVGYVRASVLERESNCYYDNKVSTGEVGRLMQCPSNAALIVFDTATFVGESINGYVNVCKSTTYDFPQGDDCTWRTEQRISGALDHGLAYAYSEAPVAGRACTLACRARADVGLVHVE
jgi:hypothetical protein